MTLIEILEGLLEGRFLAGEILESIEGFWFEIKSNGYLLGKTQEEVFEIGQLTIPPSAALNNS